MAPAMTIDEAKAAFDQAYEHQVVASQHYRGSAQYPPSVADAVISAAVGARQAVARAEGESVREWLADALRRLDAALERFREIEDDEDGYGAATFHALWGALHGLEDTL